MGTNVLLGISPFDDETNLDANSHISLIEFVLSVYKMSLANVLSLTGENCNTNKAISNPMSIPFIGCASHLLNLAVNDMLER